MQIFFSFPFSFFNRDQTLDFLLFAIHYELSSVHSQEALGSIMHPAPNEGFAKDSVRRLSYLDVSSFTKICIS